MNLNETYITLSPDGTEKIGAELAEEILASAALPRFVALFGDLGVGKTAFVRGFTSAIAPQARVKSPTFALVNEYHGPSLAVFHFDMYRITDEDELYAIGFYDYADRGGICMTEWSENIPYALPEQYLRVCLEKTDIVDQRRIVIELIQA